MLFSNREYALWIEDCGAGVVQALVWRQIGRLVLFFFGITLACAVGAGVRDFTRSLQSG